MLIAFTAVVSVLIRQIRDYEIDAYQDTFVLLYRLNFKFYQKLYQIPFTNQ